MQFLRTLWPTPFRIQKKNVASFIIQLVIFLVVCTVVAWLMSILSEIVILGIVFKLIGSLMEIYSTVGIVLCILNFIGVF